MPDQFVIPKKNRIHFAFADGKLKPSGLKDVDFSSPTDVKEIFQTHLTASGKKALSIYFHGGLVSSTDEFGNPGFPYRPENKGLFEAVYAEFKDQVMYARGTGLGLPVARA